MDSSKTEQNMPKALLAWYDFAPDSKILFVKGDAVCDVIGTYLSQKYKDVCIADRENMPCGETYDYIVMAGVIERSTDPENFLKQIYMLLKQKGTLLVGTNNRLGIRYFCGDRDPFSGRLFDGIDNYAQINAYQRKQMPGRVYAKAELERMIGNAGFACVKCYSVMPGLVRPQLLLADEQLPNEPLDERIMPQYDSPAAVFLDEVHLYASLLENGLFHSMANGYLFECTKNGLLSVYDEIILQSDRNPKGALATLATKNRSVKKKALYPQGIGKISEMAEKQLDLQEHHVPMVQGEVAGDTYVMPYVDGEIATGYFQKLLKRDKDEFIRELTAFFEIVLHSSEHVPYEDVNWEQFEPRWRERKKDDPNIDKWRKAAFGTAEERKNIGVILKRGYFDLVSLNCFHTSDGFFFFDQEFYVENFPANVILLRTVDLIYGNRLDLEQIYPRDELLKHFSMYEYRNIWRAKSNEFLEKLRSEKGLAVYHKRHRIDQSTMNANRLRMNYPQYEYQQLFINIFHDLENKKIYLFGSGRYARAFLEQFGQQFSVAGIVDNGKSRWGQTLEGIPITSPEVLREERQPYKVFICIRDFDEVLAQLRKMGVKHCGIYNPNMDYERPVAVKMSSAEKENTAPKPYHIGYVAGVFDLFHIGHLNLLRRAKEQCDYLIVGVVSDEQVIQGKKTTPYIPFAERMEIVAACRYVDEAVAIPIDRAGTEAAWHMYHFDVQFSGSDYEHDPVWAGQRAFLQQHGAEMVFFPYTQGTSSTKLKEKING